MITEARRPSRPDEDDPDSEAAADEYISIPAMPKQIFKSRPPNNERTNDKIL